MDNKEKDRINALMDLQDKNNKTRVLTNLESLLEDIEALGLEKTDIAYVIRDRDNLIHNWLYDPIHLDGFFGGVMEQVTIKELLEEFSSNLHY